MMNTPNRLPSPALSWLAFNRRILSEAADPAVPLVERVKFLAIFNSNLDEFYTVRITELRRDARSGRESADGSGLSPHAQLQSFQREMERALALQDTLWREQLLPALAAHGLNVISDEEAASVPCLEYFDGKIRPFLKLPRPEPGNFAAGSAFVKELALAVAFSGSAGGQNFYAVIELPPELPRWHCFQGAGKTVRAAALETLIEAALPRLYPQWRIAAVLPFRVLRDNDYHFDAVAPDVLPHTILQKFQTRGERETVRLDLARRPAGSLKEMLLKVLPVTAACRYEFDVPLRTQDLDKLIPPALRQPPLTDEYWEPIRPEWFQSARPMWETVARRHNLLLAPPYHTFEPLLQLLRTAAGDPAVVRIRQTLYRVAAHSQVLDELCRAARNGKEVTVLLELKARFDEEKNVFWARRLQEAGVRVLFGIPKLKVHAKLLLIERRTADGGCAGVLHLSTGNYNEDTAGLYADYGLFTDDAAMVNDARHLFNWFQSGGTLPAPEFQKLTAAPFGLREKILALIDREIRHARNGRPGRITARLNNLTDPEVIAKLHEAAHEHVTLKLAVRGICCYVPCEREPVTAVRVIDRFLEHGRAFRFANNGDEEVFLSSADWMPRNFDRRVELLFPVSGIVAGAVRNLLEFPFHDSVKGSFLFPDGRWRKKLLLRGEASQEAAYRFWHEMAASTENLTISLYRPGDEFAMAELAQSVAHEITAGYTPKGVALYDFNTAPEMIGERQQKHGALTLIARLGEITAGVLEINDFSHLNMLFTAPSLRGKGVAAALLNRALTLLARLPAAERPLKLTVFAAPDAFEVYRRFGFTATGEMVKDDVQYLPMALLLKKRMKE